MTHKLELDFLFMCIIYLALWRKSLHICIRKLKTVIVNYKKHKIMKTVIQNLFILSGLLLSLGLNAQQDSWTHYYKNLTINDQLELNNHFWLATDQGLFKVDKSNSNVTHYHKGNSALPDNHIQTLSKDITGNLWIGTYDLAMAMVPANGANWTVVNYPSLVNSLIVYNSDVAPNGDLWLGSNRGLLQYDGQSWTQHPLSCYGSNPPPVWDVKVNSNGKVFAGSVNLFTLENGQCQEYHSDSLGFGAYGDAILHLENDSVVWYLTDGAIVRRFDGQNWQNWNTYYDLPVNASQLATNMLLDPNGNLAYLGYDNVLCAYNGTNWVVDSSLYWAAPANFNGAMAAQFDGVDDFWVFDGHQFFHKNSTAITSTNLVELHPFNLFSKMYKDKMGMLYSLNYSYGVHQIDGDNWMSENISVNGNQPTAFREMAFDAENEKWIIAEIGGALTILEENNGTWVMHDSSSTAGILPTDATVYHLEITPNNRLWLMDGDDLIYQYYNGNWTIENHITTNSFSSDFTSDDNGNIFWVEYLNPAGYSLKKFNGTTVHSYSFPQNEGFLLQPQFDDDGILWMTATNGNLYQFDGMNFTTVNYGPSSVYPQDLLVEGDQIFVGTTNEGIYHFDGNNWQHITEMNSGLSDNETRGLILNHQNQLWIQTGSGKVMDVWNMGVNTAVETLEEHSQDLLIYPNPVKNRLTIESNLKEARLEIFDLQGQLIMRKESINFKEQLELGELPAACYLLRVSNGNTNQQQVFIKY